MGIWDENLSGPPNQPHHLYSGVLERGGGGVLERGARAGSLFVSQRHNSLLRSFLPPPRLSISVRAPVSSPFLRLHPPTGSGVMFQKRRSSVVNPDAGRCKWIRNLLRGQPVHDLVFPSEEAESRRLRKDTPGCCEGVLRLVSPAQVRPRWRERTHQTLRGIGKRGWCHPQWLTPTLPAFQRCQGEDRGPYTPVGQVQTEHYDGGDRRRPRGNGSTQHVDQVRTVINDQVDRSQLSLQYIQND